MNARNIDIEWKDIATQFEPRVNRHRELLQKVDSFGGAWHVLSGRPLPYSLIMANVELELPLTERYLIHEASIRRCTNEPTRLQHPVLRNSGNARRVCLLPYPTQ